MGDGGLSGVLIPWLGLQRHSETSDGGEQDNSSCVKDEVSHPGLPVPNKPYGFCGRKATLKNRVQELCES